MGPSAREILKRIEAGERVSPEQARGAVIMLADAYDEMHSIVADASRRHKGIRSPSSAMVLFDIRNAFLIHEALLRNEDLSLAYGAIASTKAALKVASESQKEIE